MGLRKARERRSKARAGGELLRGGRGRGRHLRRRRYGAGRSRSSGSSCCGWTLFLGGASRRLRRLYYDVGSELMEERAVAEEQAGRFWLYLLRILVERGVRPSESARRRLCYVCRALLTGMWNKRVTSGATLLKTEEV